MPSEPSRSGLPRTSPCSSHPEEPSAEGEHLGPAPRWRVSHDRRGAQSKAMRRRSVRAVLGEATMDHTHGIRAPRDLDPLQEP